MEEKEKHPHDNRALPLTHRRSLFGKYHERGIYLITVCTENREPLLGKLKGETPKEALIREIREELGTEITVGEKIMTVEYDYPAFHLSMDCFWCEVRKGDLELREHEAARWLTAETLEEVDWLPADVELIRRLRGELAGSGRKEEKCHWKG